MKFSLLLIDDNDSTLQVLRRDVSKLLPDAEVRVWGPGIEDSREPLAAFTELVDDNTLLVVTDYDLTEQGRTGLFGSTIVGWCHSKAIPVGDYSRGNKGALPDRPSLFELRVPSSPEQAAAFVVRAFDGFRRVREHIQNSDKRLDKMRSPAAVLAGLLGRPDMESQFTLYGAQLSTNSVLRERVMRAADADVSVSEDERSRVLGYVVGHLLLNSILEFPGPILSLRALTAYCGCGDSESHALADVFDGSTYTGPFSEGEKYYWLSDVDDRLAELLGGLPDSKEFDTPGELHREAIELHMRRPLARPSCARCSGKNGGFICPFTSRVVCQLPDCSVSSGSWVPRGAVLCRIERDFYDEWGPALGI